MLYNTLNIAVTYLQHVLYYIYIIEYEIII